MTDSRNQAYAGYFLGFKADATQTGKCRGVYDPRGAQNPDHDPIWPTPVVCDAPGPNDVYIAFDINSVPFFPSFFAQISHGFPTDFPAHGCRVMCFR